MRKLTDFKCSKTLTLNQYGPTTIKHHKLKNLKRNVIKSKTRKALNYLTYLKSNQIKSNEIKSASFLYPLN